MGTIEREENLYIHNLSDLLQSRLTNPADIITYMDFAPFAYALTNMHFRALVEHKKVSTGFVRRRFGVYHPLYDNSLFFD